MHAEPGSIRRPRHARWVWLAAYLLFAAACVQSLRLHLLADLSFPVPWPDELHFGEQARALARSGSLHAERLHPHRALAWMPPGYFWLTAPVHRLAWALDWSGADTLRALRGLSWAAAVLGACAIRVLLQHTTRSTLGNAGASLLASLLAGAWLLHPSVVAGSNVARMDLVGLALGLWGGVALLRTRPWLAAAALGLTPLLHPNGLYLAGAAVAWWFLIRRDLRRPAAVRPTLWEQAIIATLATAWLSYLFWILGSEIHRLAFVEDMHMQLARKATRSLWSAMTSHHGWRALVAMAVALRLGLNSRRKTAGAPDDRGLLVALLFACWLLARVGHEMWYEPFDALVLVLLGALVVSVAAAWSGLAPGNGVLAYAAPVGALVIFALVFNAHRPHSAEALRWKRMRIHHEPYVDEHELVALQRALTEAQLFPEGARLQLSPRGDAALLWGLDDAQLGARWVDDVRFDWRAEHGVMGTLVHLHPAHPSHWQRRAEKMLDAARSETAPHPARAQRLLDTEGRQWWWVPAAPSQSETRE